ncbi:MAG: hypothetical protein ACYC2G_05330 [Gemmatimonadaceae bacterium]
MLAYVFWHWPQPTADRSRYESLQDAFHAALAADPSPGFLRSFSHAVVGAPWATGGAAAYEDWYLTDGSAALEPLNDAAVSASRLAPHDAAAAGAAGGTAGLYTLRRGAPIARPRHEYWFAKPAGMRYDTLFAALAPTIAAATAVVERDGGGAALWGRFMTLGPSPEFCLQTSSPVVLPDVIDALELVLDP